MNKRDIPNGLQSLLQRQLKIGNESSVNIFLKNF